eukprot:23889-Pelagococcus_subviridis.AAC.1
MPQRRRRGEVLVLPPRRGPPRLVLLRVGERRGRAAQGDLEGVSSRGGGRRAFGAVARRRHRRRRRRRLGHGDAGEILERRAQRRALQPRQHLGLHARRRRRAVFDIPRELGRDARRRFRERVQADDGEGSQHLRALGLPSFALLGEYPAPRERLERAVQRRLHRLRAQGRARQGRAADVRERARPDDGAERARRMRTRGRIRVERPAASLRRRAVAVAVAVADADARRVRHPPRDAVQQAALARRVHAEHQVRAPRDDRDAAAEGEARAREVDDERDDAQDRVASRAEDEAARAALRAEDDHRRGRRRRAGGAGDHRDADAPGSGAPSARVAARRRRSGDRAFRRKRQPARSVDG